MSLVTKLERELGEAKLRDARDDLAILADRFTKIAEEHSGVRSEARRTDRSIGEILCDLDAAMGWEE